MCVHLDLVINCKFLPKYLIISLQAVRAFEVEAVGASSVAALSQFLPTPDEGTKVGACVFV